MTIRSGRKRSGPVADFYNEVLGSNGRTTACWTSDWRPGQLNFAINGTLTFDHGGHTYTGAVVIAQGSSYSRNNWWVEEICMVIFTTGDR